MSVNVRVAVRLQVETEAQAAACAEALANYGYENTVIQSGGWSYLPWGNEYGDVWATRPCSEDEYDSQVGGKQVVHVRLENLPLPWVVVTDIPGAQV